MAKNKIELQAAFCCQMMDKLFEAVNAHETARSKGKWHLHSELNEYGNGVKASGACKIQIQSDIVRLRRELSALSKMLEDDE